MLRYDRSTRHPPNYLSGRQQWQVLRLVIGLGLILMLMNQFRNPRAIEALGIFFGAQPRSPQAAAGDHSSSVDDHDPATEGPRSASSQLPVRFEGLREVEDNTPFRREDTGPWFQLLGILHDASKSQLTSGAIPNLTAVQLLEQPEAYRGRLITLHGTARQSIPIDPLAS